MNERPPNNKFRPGVRQNWSSSQRGGRNNPSSWHGARGRRPNSRFETNAAAAAAAGGGNWRNNNASNRHQQCEAASNHQSFTIIKPPDSDFTIIKNADDDFDAFSARSDLTPEGAPSPDQRGDIYSQLSLRESNFFVFSSKTSSDVLKMCYLYAVARLIHERETDEALIPAIAAAEFAADYLPRGRRLFGRAADAYFVEVMRRAVRDPAFVLKVRPNQRLYATLEEFGLPRQYPTPRPEPLTGEQYMRILQILSTSLDPAYADCDLVVSLTALAPCLRLHGVEETSLRRLEAAVRDELRRDIRLDLRATSIFFERYMSGASESEIEEMLVYWRLTLPDKAPKLKRLAKRGPGNGLVAITLIGRALTECPGFAWRQTLGMYPSDWKAVDQAIREIDNDPYYGYRQKKSELVDTRRYQNIAWLSSYLCRAVLGDEIDYSAQDPYLSEPPTNFEDVKRLVAMYVAELHRDSDMTES